MSYDNLERLTYQTIISVQKMGRMHAVLPPFPYLDVPEGAFDLTWELLRLRAYQEYVEPVRLPNPKEAPFVDEIEPDITPNEIRFRLEDPQRFKKKTFRYKYLPGTEGIAIVAAKRRKQYKSPTRRKEDPMVAQSLRFDRYLWTVPEALDWAVSHNFLKPARRQTSFARAANPGWRLSF